MSCPAIHHRQRIARFRPWGFTLLEALVVLAVLGVLLSLAVPSLSNLVDKHRLQAQAEGLLASLQLARSEAIRRQQPITVCPRADQVCDANAAWDKGWLVFADANHNARYDEGEGLIEAHEPMPAKVLVGVTSTVKGYFSYGPEGRSKSTSGAFMAGSWRFCQNTSSQGWRVVSNALGKPRLETYTATPCP
jgi:type IV fimbrial biogenesis protein FimT